MRQRSGTRRWSRRWWRPGRMWMPGMRTAGGRCMRRQRSGAWRWSRRWWRPGQMWRPGMRTAGRHAMLPRIRASSDCLTADESPTGTQAGNARRSAPSHGAPPPDHGRANPRSGECRIRLLQSERRPPGRSAGYPGHRDPEGIRPSEGHPVRRLWRTFCASILASRKSPFPFTSRSSLMEHRALCLCHPHPEFEHQLLPFALSC